MFILAIMSAGQKFNYTFENILKTAYDNYKHSKECKEGEDDDSFSYDVAFNMMFNKFQHSLTTNDGKTKCQVFLKFLGKCISDVFSRNNMFQQYNKDFADMKAGMANINSKDMTQLYAFVEKHLPPKSFEKKQFGEVFTPLELVQEMLDAIEKYADKDLY
jgi:hypothetical protein